MSGPSERLIAGIDEVGRGCIAGPVITAVVVFHEQGSVIRGLTDSKLLKPRQRRELATAIESRAVAWAIGRAEVPEIDRLNILQATFLAMRRAHDALSIKPQLVLVDGNRYPELPTPGQAIIGGDRTVPVISAASILAKVFRDREMDLLERLYPGFGFAKHKGYPTESHRTALQQLGASPAHRQSFAPVKRSLSSVRPVL